VSLTPHILNLHVYYLVGGIQSSQGARTVMVHQMSLTNLYARSTTSA
jgi:hypothetical protein